MPLSARIRNNADGAPAPSARSSTGARSAWETCQALVPDCAVAKTNAINNPTPRNSLISGASLYNNEYNANCTGLLVQAHKKSSLCLQ